MRLYFVLYVARGGGFVPITWPLTPLFYLKIVFHGLLIQLTVFLYIYKSFVI